MHTSTGGIAAQIIMKKSMNLKGNFVMAVLSVEKVCVAKTMRMRSVKVKTVSTGSTQVNMLFDNPTQQ